MNLEEYINYLVFDFLSNFYNKAKKIEANIYFSNHSLQISKSAKSIKIYFHRTNKNVLNTETLGNLNIYGDIMYQIYLTAKFEWVIILNNEKLIKVDKGLIDYIFYKVFNIL